MRKIAIRLDAETAREAAAYRELCFDGLELALESLPVAEREAPLLARRSPRSLPVIAVAASCKTTDLDIATPAIIKGLAATARIGATCLNLSLPHLETTNDPRGFRSYQSAINFVHRIYGATRFEAERAGVALAVEVANGGCFLSPVEMRELIDISSSWAVGVCLDTARLAAIGDPADWIRTLTHRVHAVRVTCDPKSDNRLLRQTACALEDTGFDRTICITCATEPAPALQMLRDAGLLPLTG